MLKKITVLTLFLICSISIFAQIPPKNESEQRKTLVYNESKDKKDPEYVWGFMWNYQFDFKEDFILDFILQNGKIFFFITENGVAEKPTNISNKKLALKNDLDNKLNKEKREKELAKMVSDAFKVWFTDTAAAIRNTNRTQEFADILPILDKSVTPTLVSNNFKYYTQDNYHNNVIKEFYFTDIKEMRQICKTNWAAGCIGGPSNSLTLVNPFIKQKDPHFTKNAIFGYLVHEIGHAYGLADQYVSGAGNADSEYSTKKDRVGGYLSVMGGGDYVSLSNLSCDDIDGFINLIDFTLSQQKKRKFPGIRKKGWSDRAKNGWASFCNGKEGYKNTFYKEAKPVQSL